ncbi:Pdp3-interacting factor 1 [Hyphodiscus hymeniophilus]|uniref:Pdp3-interacting factor 1 n=1 Tax=Hyphodiscus hymeniophilus TaxID=353542 RepID=A0A9P6VEA2_9HELO|nr:Pdp3-interacting factor 1 [Hyphodiscus hymeniophilus]
MAPSTLPAMKTNPRFIFFTDFDGTITQRDSNDFLTDNLGYGEKLRKQGNQDVLHDRMSFRDSFRGMMDSVKTPYDQCIKTLLENIKLDPYFAEFYEWARANNVPVVVLSSGMEPIIRALLIHLVGKTAEDIQIVSNEVEGRDGKDINTEGGWQIVFHDESHFGHDKSMEIRPYAALPESERPTMFYAGDGVSDLSAAKETDLLFAKKGHDLVSYCVKQNVPFTEFEDWSSILATVKDIVAGKTSVKKVSAEGVEAFKSGRNEK